MTSSAGGVPKMRQYVPKDPQVYDACPRALPIPQAMTPADRPMSGTFRKRVMNHARNFAAPGKKNVMTIARGIKMKNHIRSYPW